MKSLCSALLDGLVLPLQDKMEEWKKVRMCVCVRSLLCLKYIYNMYMSTVFICVHVFVFLFVELFVVDGRRCVCCMKVYCIFYAIFFIFLYSFFA